MIKIEKMLIKQRLAKKLLSLLATLFLLILASSCSSPKLILQILWSVEEAEIFPFLCQDSLCKKRDFFASLKRLKLKSVRPTHPVFPAL